MRSVSVPEEFILASRASPLAMVQARQTQAMIEAKRPDLVGHVHIHAQATTGDRLLDRTLIEAGGKGLFTRELDRAQLDGKAHIAVHSTKDVPTRLPEGLEVAAFLPRADVRDCFITADGLLFDDLPEGASIGTASLRRRAIALALRPDLDVVPIRGNVQSRLNKIQMGLAAGTFLARAGLDRLNLDGVHKETLSTDRFLPAPGQGAIMLTTRTGDNGSRDIAALLHDTDTADAVIAERACLAALDGSCRTPIAAYATLEGDRLTLNAKILSINGTEDIAAHQSADRRDAAALGADVGRTIRQKAGEGFFRQLEQDMMALLANEM